MRTRETHSARCTVSKNVVSELIANEDVAVKVLIIKLDTSKLITCIFVHIILLDVSVFFTATCHTRSSALIVEI